MVGLEGKESVVAGWGLIFTSIAAGNGIAVWGPQLVGQAKNLLVGGVTTGIVTAIVAAAGSMVMSNMVSSDGAQEVSDAS
jgi:high-affinity Fe2+/Pb2+ permease